MQRTLQISNLTVAIIPGAQLLSVIEQDLRPQTKEIVTIRKLDHGHSVTDRAQTKAKKFYYSIALPH